ncbi:MAG: AsmA family protein [Roseiarcus sp.]
MRITLTLIAVALVVALSAALFAPFFIDWSLHRAQIEAELGDILGARVVVSGPIDIRFLPTPYLQLKNVTVADPRDDGAPVFSCENVQLEAALASLPSGRARFTLARLEHPVLTLSRGSGGSVLFPRWRFKAQADRVALDRVVVTGGRLRVAGDDGAAPLEIAGLDLDAAAGSLIGPYRGSGRVSTPAGPPAEFHFATAALANSALPLKLEIDPAEGLPSGVFDGALALGRRSADAGLGLAYSGAAAVSGFSALTESGPPSPWRVSGALHADLGGATMENLILRFGPEERALEASGTARLEIGPLARLSADLKAKQLNVDALLREKGEDSVSPARALAALARVLSPLNVRGGSPLALRIAFATPTVIVGAQTLTDVALDATAAAGAPIEGDLDLGLPGQSTLRLSGALELGSAAGFKGRLEARLGDFAQLRNWATKEEPEFAQRLSALGEALPYSRASAIGDVEVSAVGFSARNLQLVVDRTALSGAMAFTRPLGVERGRLFMDLRSDALDVDALPNLSASADFLGDIDLSLALDAAKLRVARVGEATIDSGSLSLKVTKTGADLSLDRLSVAGLGGATVEVHGASGPQGRWLTLQLDAEKLRDFAALIARVAPGRLSRLLVQRADALSPAKATLEARASGPGAVGGLALDSVKARGSAGQSQFTFKAERSGEAAAGVAATFALDAPEGAALLRQVGLKAPSVSSGRARIEASANGRWDSGFDAQVAASIAGANFTWRGRVRPDAKTEDDAVLFGAATVRADNVMPVLATLGLGAPVATPIVPVDLSGDLVLRGWEVGFPRLAGTAAGAKITGQLRWRPAIGPIAASSVDPDVMLAQSIAGEPQAAPTAQIDGEISLDHASLAALLSLPLGAPQPAAPGAKWSEAKFAPPLVDPPPLDVRLKIGALDVVDALQAHGATARLKMDRGRLDIDEFAMDVAGARASGRVVLRRDGAVATLTGQVSLDAAAVDRAGLSGRFGASLAFVSTGQNPSALVAGLVGEGQIVTAGVAIPRLDPGALGRVFANAQAPDASIDETNIAHALGIELDRLPMRLPDGTAPAAMNAGVIHVGPIDIAGQSGHVSTNADFDLRSQNLTIRATFAEAGGGKFWSGPPPSVAVAVTGSVDAPAREIDAAALAAGLAAQAIARESDRIAALEADMRERAFFNRRLKAERFMRLREEELAAYAVDQARIKSEQDRKRVEDKLLKASEAQEKTGAPVTAAPAASSGAPQASTGAATIGATVSPPPLAEPKLRADQPDPTAGGLY